MASSSDLKVFYSDEVEFPSQLLARYINIAEQEVRVLLRGMRSCLRSEIDPRIADGIIPTGSSYEGLKVKGDMELDFMIALSHPEIDFIPITDYGIPCGYRKIRAVRKRVRTYIQSTSWSSVHDTHTFENDFTKDGYLIPSKMSNWFQSIADRAMNQIQSQYKTRFVGNYPARTLIITVAPNTEIWVDLVPAISIESDLYVVAKPLKTGPDIDLWRLSFSIFERNILNNIPRSSCHLKTLKILKYLREHDQRLEETSQFSSGICSYYLKTAFLHLLTSTHPAQWLDSGENLRDRLRELIDFLIEGMQTQQLNHFFIGNPASKTLEPRLPDSIATDKPLNLFDGKFMNPATLSQATKRLVKIRNFLPHIIQQHNPTRRGDYNLTCPVFSASLHTTTHQNQPQY